MQKVTPDRQAIGRLGEEIACQALIARGYVIQERNWRCRRGEVDIVARDGEIWAFVEVKARRGHATQLPEEAVTETKLARLVELAQTYLAEKELRDVDWRIDLVAIEFGRPGEAPRVNLITGLGAW
jgi:putative endonuclease